MTNALDAIFDRKEFENLFKYNIYSTHRNVRSESTKDGFNIYVIAPGARKDKIQITLNSNNCLNVQYNASPDALSDSFYYSIPLGRVKVTNYSASYEDGIIRINLTTGQTTPDLIKIPLA